VKQSIHRLEFPFAEEMTGQRERERERERGEKEREERERERV
jgi:hypothetical protein